MTKKPTTKAVTTRKRKPPARREIYVLKSSIARDRHERDRDEAAKSRLAIEAEIVAIQDKAAADARAIVELANIQAAILKDEYEDLHVVELAAIAALQSMEMPVGGEGHPQKPIVVPLKIADGAS